MNNRILVLGASGHIAHFAIEKLLKSTNDHLVLFTRHSQSLNSMDPDRTTIVKGDTLNPSDLAKAMEHVNIVYANLSNPEIKQQAQNIVAAMDQHQIKPLIWISSIGIYDEVPGKFGEWNNAMLRKGNQSSYLGTYRATADVIEQSDLDYTIIRPAWLTNKDEVDYETTEKGEPFKGTEVSRKSIGYLVAEITQNPQKFVHRSIGVNKPGTDGDKPSWY